MKREWTTADLEASLARELDGVCEALITTLGANLHAVVLGGGFGRGEGSLELREGVWIPSNDLDLFLVVEEAVAPELLVRARGSALSRTRVREVDLLPRVRSELPRLPPTLESLELREGHRVVHGPGDILDAMPRWRPEELPRFEIENLLRNRLVTLVEGCPDVFGALPGARVCAYQTAKAALAAVDARLLRGGQHRTRYAEKVERFATVADPAEIALAREALAIKLGASADRSPGSDEDLWVRSAQLLLKELLALFREGEPLVPGVGREATLASLVRSIHFRSVSRARTLRGLVRVLLGGDPMRSVDACLLALVAERLGEPPGVSWRGLLRRAALGELAGATHEARARAVVSRWYALRKASPTTDSPCAGAPSAGPRSPESAIS